MTLIEERVLKQMRSLPLTVQREVLDFVEFLSQKHNVEQKKSRRSLRGLWADLQIEDFTLEELSSVRKEVWANLGSRLEE
jgi:hypothetical protein